MNILKYEKNGFRPDGIFGAFQFAGDPGPFMVTLSHAYKQQDGSYLPIVMPGAYTCVRGTHALEDGVPFETFEIKGVLGHSGLLFHNGNFNKDSKGCVLCGENIRSYDAEADQMVTNSRATFAAFMDRLKGVDSFNLQVIIGA